VFDLLLNRFELFSGRFVSVFLVGYLINKYIVIFAMGDTVFPLYTIFAALAGG